jgi:N-acetylmuramic acid 6-phosphate etherase
VENLMVDVKAKNQKLKERCARIVKELKPVTIDEAWGLLEQNEWSIRRVLDVLEERQVATK